MRFIFRKTSVIALFSLFFLSAVGLVQAEDLTADTILKQMKEKWSGSQSMQADVSMNANLSGLRIKIDGTMWQKAKLFRAEMTIPPEVLAGSSAAGSSLAPLKMLMVFDGAVMWQHFSMMNMVTKIDMAAVESKLPGGMPPRVFLGGSLPENVSYKVSAVTRSNKNYYLMEVKDIARFIKNAFPPGTMVNIPANMQFQKVAVWVGRDSLFPEIIEFFTTADTAMMAMEFKNIKVNPDLSPDLFVFNVPEGVQPVDMTPMVLAQLEAAAKATNPPASKNAVSGSAAPAQKQ